MTVLWYAIGIYIVGVAIVLYARPQIMFREDGMWKEFGLATETNQTIFPFWMFALVWAILSYALASLMSIFFASVALRSEQPSALAMAKPNASFMQPISTHPNVPMMPTLPTQSLPSMIAPPMTNAATKVPGYYILDPYATPAHPRYIYYGSEPPGIPPVN
jgi:hypothetical protein